MKEATFVCASLFERPAKIAAALLLQGFTVDLITSNGSIQPTWRRYFRNVGVVSSIDDFKSALSSLHFSSPIHHFTSAVDAFTIALLNLNKRFVFDYKDVFPKVLTLPSDGQSAVLDAILDRDLPVFHRDSQLDRYISKSGKSHPTFYKHVPDFIWHNLPPPLGRYGSDNIQRNKKVAFVGNFSIEAIEPHYAGLGQLTIIESLVRQGFQYHMFPFRHDRKDEDPLAMRDYVALSKNQRGFIFEGRQLLPQLQHKLREMGWGSLLLPACHFAPLNESHYLIAPFIGVPARFSDYIGAGLPLLTSEGLVEANDLINNYGIGVSVCESQISSLNAILEDSNYQAIRKNVSAFGSEMLSSNKWAKTLQHYYKEIFC